MYKTITDYNEHNNTPLLNKKIWEEIRTIIKEESISDANDITADTFIHASNTQRENANTIFTSEKIDKSDDLEDTLKNLTINNAEYYVSNSATTIDAKGDSASNSKTVTHTSDEKGKVTDTSNGNLQQTLFSNQTLSVFFYDEPEDWK